MGQGDTWNRIDGGTAETVVQAGSIGTYVVNQVAPNSTLPDEADEWVRLAFESTVWQHASANFEAFRQQVCAVVVKLAELRDQVDQRLADDPWQDPNLVSRFAERTMWLLGEPASSSLDLYPAEAALLVLVPFLYRTHFLLLASEFADIDPAALDHKPAPNRADFEAFAGNYEGLVERTLRRQEATGAVGWWLFHRWLAQREEFGRIDHVQELIAQIGAPARELGEVLNPARVSKLLHSLRRGPDVCNPEFLGQLHPDDRVGRHQRLREQRVALLTCLAYATSIEMTALPTIVVDHLAIPYPVDLEQLRETLSSAYWGGSPDVPILRAHCTHEAVIEGLREYAARADDLLHAVRRTANERITQPMPNLPTRFSSDGVVPVDGVFTYWASFRLDEQRIRDLLMGVQLYKDRDLAVRELYQNALDACRYRRARTEYLERTEPAKFAYSGQIEFKQGTDENGREYLECHDNGIGMGESELRGVFSNAGARFAEQPDFKLERSAWKSLEPPVKFYPNSRFGIGVMSYFMLADEIRVTTCRLGTDGRPGPTLEVSIFGPGHLFRIVECAEQGSEAGTRVRLYLRADPDRPATWSCVNVLERLLGIAEFPTTAQHEGHFCKWNAGELKQRRAPAGENFGLEAYGARVAWAEAPEDVHVVWCEHGGALLVDGLIVQPAKNRSVLSSGTTGLNGVVVNLSGDRAPERLSADRVQVLDDIADQVSKLLEQAAMDLVISDSILPSFEWICRIADTNITLADLITKATVTNKTKLQHPPLAFEAYRTGCFPADVEILAPHEPTEARCMTPGNKIPDHILLWRLLAHRHARTLPALAEICPEITNHADIQPAIPSDESFLCFPVSFTWSFRQEEDLRSIEHLFEISSQHEITLRAAAARLSKLGIQEFRPADFPDSRVNHVPSRANQRSPGELVEVLRIAEAAKHNALLRRNLDDGSEDALWPGELVQPGHLAQASLKLGKPISEVCNILSEHGLKVDQRNLPEWPDERISVLLSKDLDGRWPWLSWTERVPPGHVLKAARKLASQPLQILSELADFGFTVPDSIPKDVTPEDQRLLGEKTGQRFMSYPGPLSYLDIFQTADDLERPLSAVVDRLREYGFEIPLRSPPNRTPLDDALLQPIDLWLDVNTDSQMPFAHVVLASRSLQSNPRDVAERLTGYGVEISRCDLPQGLSFEETRELLTDFRYGEDVLIKKIPVPLKRIIDGSQRMHAPINQVATWLRELGLNVPDVATTIREALARVPRRDANDI